MLGYILDMATSYYGKLFLVDMGIQWVGWIIATIFKTEKFYDLTGLKSLMILNSINVVIWIYYFSI
jgi:hypothetical protein